MAARRETRSEHNAFLARLEGKSFGERRRQIIEHRAYLAGTRDVDADFRVRVDVAAASEGKHTEATPAATSGGGETAATPAAASGGGETSSMTNDVVETAPAAASAGAAATAATPAVSRPRAPLPRPPRGKEACYIANAKKLVEKRLREEADKSKGAPGKKKMAKRHQAEIRREEKKTKDARALAKASSASSARSVAKHTERTRLAAEELRGGDARDAALSQLQLQQREDAAKKEATSKAAGKRKASSKGKKKRKKTSPHVDDPDGDEEADDESASTASPAELVSPIGELEQASMPSRRTTRSLTMDSVGNDEPNVNVAVDTAPRPQTPNGDTLDSDVEGDVESDDWYTEKEVVTTTGSGSRGEDGGGQSPSILDVGEEVEDDQSGESDGGLDGNALRNREKKRVQRQMDRARLAAAKAKLTREWATTTNTWDTLTTEEMEVLALDEDALKKMRADGWDFDSSSQPERTEPYPSLYDGGYGPTAEVL